MRAIMIMFDTLNRHFLPPYGCDWVHAPNFERLAKRSVRFDTAYVGSLPCMPARRELHTGRYNVLHRSWGPMEPFDDSLPENLKNAGIYTHLVSDHYHYWEDGGCTYHTRYSSWEIARGQEGDPWRGMVDDPFIDELAIGRRGYMWRPNWINRRYIDSQEKQPQHVTFAAAEEFIKTNASGNNWFLQIETFDPHEPYYTFPKYKALYPHDYDGPRWDWPTYEPVGQTPDQVEHLRYEYAALLSMCDEYLGKILDMMDTYSLWHDTMLIVNTDHGFLLGEHDWVAKNVPPQWEEISHVPLFIWDPRHTVRGESRKALVQTIDLVPTLYNFFGVPMPDTVEGRDMAPVIENDTTIRDAALFGLHGGHLNVTDGQRVLMRAPLDPDDKELYNYTLMPTHINRFFSMDEIRTAELAGPFSFTKGAKVLKTRADGPIHNTIQHTMGDLLYDLQEDPKQANPLDPESDSEAAAVKTELLSQMGKLMEENDAPEEVYVRYGVPLPG